MKLWLDVNKSKTSSAKSLQQWVTHYNRFTAVLSHKRLFAQFHVLYFLLCVPGCSMAFLLYSPDWKTVAKTPIYLLFLTTHWIWLCIHALSTGWSLISQRLFCSRKCIRSIAFWVWWARPTRLLCLKMSPTRLSQQTPTLLIKYSVHCHGGLISQRELTFSHMFIYYQLT